MLHNHGGRNNKLCDQKGQNPKGVRQAKKPTKRNPSFIPLSKSKLIMKRLSLDDERVLVKLYDDTTKSVLPHLQLIENDLYPEKYVACIYDQDCHIGVITKRSNENKDVYIKFMK